MPHSGEWEQQCEFARLLDKWLPAGAFWTATDPVASSPTSGAMRRMRRVKPGVPDTLILFRGKLMAVELKSRAGVAFESQKRVRAELIAASADWWIGGGNAHAIVDDDDCGCCIASGYVINARADDQLDGSGIL